MKENKFRKLLPEVLVVCIAESVHLSSIPSLVWEILNIWMYESRGYLQYQYKDVKTKNVY
jgi:hypothetical protein